MRAVARERYHALHFDARHPGAHANVHQHRLAPQQRVQEVGELWRRGRQPRRLVGALGQPKGGAEAGRVEKTGVFPRGILLAARLLAARLLAARLLVALLAVPRLVALLAVPHLVGGFVPRLVAGFVVARSVVARSVAGSLLDGQPRGQRAERAQVRRALALKRRGRHRLLAAQEAAAEAAHRLALALAVASPAALRLRRRLALGRGRVHDRLLEPLAPRAATRAAHGRRQQPSDVAAAQRRDGVSRLPF